MSIRHVVISLGQALASCRARPYRRAIVSLASFLPARSAYGLALADAIRSLVTIVQAFLPAPLAYGLACLRGDRAYRYRDTEREGIMRNLEDILGDQLSPAERAGVTRDFFRHRSCMMVDTMRLAGKGRALARLVEIRGLEHIEAALAAGKGAVICSAHFGFYDGCFSLIGACGFPVTTIGRWRPQSKLRWPYWGLIYLKLASRHRRRPNIEPRPGKFETAVQAAAILRANELITICSDAPPLAGDRARAVRMDFLGRQALLLPGSVIIAQHTGAPVLMAFLRRSADWRHQVLEISPPVPLDGDPVTAFERCVAIMEAAIRQNLAQWAYWSGPMVQFRPDISGESEIDVL